MSETITQCKRCLLNNLDDENITFNERGECRYCTYYDQAMGKLGDDRERKRWIDNKISEIKKAGAGKEFDCILGVSGGVDSTYLAYWAHQNGLRPLVVHFDNGWNSELAVANIRNICNKLGFSLNTFVINWEEFKEFQLAYLRAGVVDIEVLTDHAIMATIYAVARKYGIRYTINGFNYATEAVMPKGWVFNKGDWENIKDIYRKFGSRKPIKTFPHVSFLKKLFYHWFLRLESIQVLNYIPYNKKEAKDIITRELGWRDYGGKHYESVFTKFYQAYILPVHFGIDKRRAHLSNLICSGQISKEEALRELQQPLYQQTECDEEKSYVCKKLGLSLQEFDLLMKGQVRKHEDFKTETRLWRNYFRMVNILKLKFR